MKAALLPEIRDKKTRSCFFKNPECDGLFAEKSFFPEDVCLCNG